jgi:hypothetical protein
MSGENEGAMQTAQTSTFHAELLDLNAMDGGAASIPAKTLDALHAGITVAKQKAHG